jgi:ribonuclease R
LWLKSILHELSSQGAILAGAAIKPRSREVAVPGELPAMAVLEVASISIDGELMARPVDWPSGEGYAPPPEIVLAPPAGARGPGAALGQIGVGDRVLARLTRLDDRRYEGRLIRRVHDRPDHILGVFQKIGGEARVKPTDKRARSDFLVAGADTKGAQAGDLVLAEALPVRPHGPARVRIVERLGSVTDPRSFSLIAIHTHDLPTQFSHAALRESELATQAELATRSDLRHLPLLTIDPVDARDRDDAVWATPDDHPANPGGWQVVVAIADVAHYVRPGSALDGDARLRGNSAYFPDRVVPMLPEALSNGLCSLAEGEDRACMAVRMRFSPTGEKIDHRFERSLMRSVAALHYAQAQSAFDGQPDAKTAPWMDSVLRPLHDAYRALKTARDKREPLAIELPERRIVLGPDGAIQGVRTEPHYDSHQLIEAFMIAANVSAAETLEQARAPCMYRVHEEPSREKVDSLREFLATLDLPFAKSQVLKPALFNRVLRQVQGTPSAPLVNQVVLRAQAQAVYSPDNQGHFGLSLRRYAHFTSPIRRYADLVVHRALIGALGLGGDGIDARSAPDMTAVAEHISMTERRAMVAERDAVDRLTAAFMVERVGASFTARISGVTRFGLFVELEETGANGLVPMRSLHDDFYTHDEARHALIGRKTRRVFRLGDSLEVRLMEAEPVTGGMRFKLLDAPTNAGTGLKPRGKAPGGKAPAHKTPGRGAPGRKSSGRKRR